MSCGGKCIWRSYRPFQKILIYACLFSGCDIPFQSLSVLFSPPSTRSSSSTRRTQAAECCPTRVLRPRVLVPHTGEIPGILPIGCLFWLNTKMNPQSSSSVFIIAMMNLIYAPEIGNHCLSIDTLMSWAVLNHLVFEWWPCPCILLELERKWQLMWFGLQQRNQDCSRSPKADCLCGLAAGGLWIHKLPFYQQDLLW